MRDHPQFSAYIALACVCFFWGTTYLGIRIALESMSPQVLICVRFLLSGSVMLVGALIAGSHLPRGRELWHTSIFGVMTLGLGTGFLAFAEVWVPSGLAALFITTSPFWFAGIEALLPGGAPLHGPTIKGLLVGSLGVAVLVAPDAWAALHGSGGHALIAGFFLLQFSSAVWSLGSLLQRRNPTQAHPFTTSAIQQLAAGVAYIIPALLSTQPVHWNTRGIGAIVYLAIFGSIVGYSAYIYALENLPIAIASIYTYVNPLVAVALGWLFYREPFGLRETFAVVLTFAGVAIVKRAQTATVVARAVD